MIKLPIELPVVHFSKQYFLIQNESLIDKKSKTVMDEIKRLFPKIDFKNCNSLCDLPKIFEKGLFDDNLDFHRFLLKNKYKKHPYETVNVKLSLSPYGKKHNLFSISTKSYGNYLWRILYSIELTGEKIQAIVDSLGPETYFPSLKCSGLFQDQEKICKSVLACNEIIDAINKNSSWMNLEPDIMFSHELLKNKCEKIEGTSNFYLFGVSQVEHENFEKLGEYNKSRLKHHHGSEIKKAFNYGPIREFYFYLLPETDGNIPSIPKKGLNPSDFQEQYRSISSLILEKFDFSYAPRV